MSSLCDADGAMTLLRLTTVRVNRFDCVLQGGPDVVRARPRAKERERETQIYVQPSDDGTCDGMPTRTNVGTKRWHCVYLIKILSSYQRWFST